MSLITPTLSNFLIGSRIYSDGSFNLTDPSSNNTNPAATFTFTSSNPNVADISGVRTVIIQNTGQTTITATQAATSGYTTAQITAVFTVTKTTTVIANFIITSKELKDGSFNLIDPNSNNPGVFLYEVLTPSIISLSGRTVTLLQVGRAQIRVTQDASTNYTSGTAIATFDVFSNIVRVGTQNRLDLSWNIPQENGGTIKNYFFYNEERQTTITPGPLVSTVMLTESPINTSYYSYALPVPYSAKIISATGAFTGIDVNFANQSFNLNTSSLAQYTASNYFDMGYYGEIELNWEYHNDRPIVELNPALIASTTMTLSIYKEASVNIGDNRIDLIFNTSRIYDSLINCFGPMPQNNNKTMTDIFTIAFPGISASDTTSESRDLKYLKHTDIVSGRVTLSSNTYSPADAPSTTREYSILIKSLRIAPFRFPISRDFTSLRLGQGISTTGVGFSVSTYNAIVSSANDSSGGVLYHMPKMTRPLTDFGCATWTFSWNYAANLSKLATDISYLPVVGDLSSNLNIPFSMRIRGYSRPYSRTTSVISDVSYNTTTVPDFLSHVSDPSYNTRMLFDLSFSDTANYAKIAATSLAADSSFGIVSRTFDISGASGFAPFSDTTDYSHTQFVFLFQLTIPDPSYNAYFRMMSTQADSFQVKMLSQTFTPHQVYRFYGPDPTIASSNALDSSTNTLYDIKDYYTQLHPNYSFYNLTNGNYYSYAISANNIAGTNVFSDRFTRRCGSVPNPIVNRINSLGADTYTIESERTSNRVNLYWEKPSFSGYDIMYFSIQTDIDISGRWVTSTEYTTDLSNTLISFNTFKDTIVYITDETKNEYDQPITTYTYKSTSIQNAVNALLNVNTPLTGTLLNGYKYYFRLSSVNEIGSSEFSSILSGIPFARPANSPIQFIGTPVIGNELVILTWRIPQDDAGSPILNYIIDYEEIDRRVTPEKYINKKRYKQNVSEHLLYEQSNRGYPFDDFRRVYAGYKRFSLLTTKEREDLITLRNEISPFVLYPRPITLSETDRFLNENIDLSNNIILTYTNRSFTYKSSLLNQNVFDFSNIQLKWYYTQDSAGSEWTTDISASFHLSIRGHLEHNSNDRSRDVSGIFDVSGTYNVSFNILSRPLDPTNRVYNYIDYITGNVISNGIIPKNIVKLKQSYPSTMYRLDANNGDGYYLKLEYTISNISRSDYRFIFYAGEHILNGVAPVRTFSGLNTEFTVTLSSNIYSPFVNGKDYLFTVTPFNINDFFPDLSLNNNYGLGKSQVSIRMGTDFKDPITDMSYSLVPTSQGGKVVLTWKYSSSPKYYINISIPTQYVQEDIYPLEYPPKQQVDGNAPAIITPNLDPVNGIVTYTIPSNLQSDIDSSNAQLYLKSGRGYEISVSPVQAFIDNQNKTRFIPAPSRSLNPDGTYIIPFRVPLAPLSLIAQGYNGSITLTWNLPNFTIDPNFYQTEIVSTYYRYKFFTLERRDISAVDTTWRDISNEIFIPTVENGGVFGYQAVFAGISGTNELPIQFRVRTVIVNEYNGERSLSDYTYMSVVNNISVIDNSLNSSVYPSVYPYMPSSPSLRTVSRSSTISGPLNGISALFDYPAYNGNADYYECFIEYTPSSGNPGSGNMWYNVFDVSNGIADLSFNISVNPSLFTTNGRLRSTTATIGGSDTRTIICRNTVANFGIRVRLYPRKNGLETGGDGFYPYYGATLYSGYSNIRYIVF